MALTTNQGLILPDGTDNANVPLTFTDFVTTAGSGMENRLVQRYLSIADRTARNAAPNEGEISYLADLNRYDGYTGSAWVALYPQNSFAVDTAAYSTSAAAYTTAGATLLGVTVTAPLSGKLRVDWAASMDQTGTGQPGFVSPQLNTGAVIGAGGLQVASADTIAISTTGADSLTMSNFYIYTGLTPGNDYNAFLQHRTTGTYSISNRKIAITQA
jgi:hypothetical protein